MAKRKKKQIKANPRLESLQAENSPKTRRELLDYDKEWLKDLKKNNPEEYKWLAQFTDEYVGASISKDSKGRVKRGHIHDTPELAKDCYDRNNRRNNDVLGVTRANHLAYDIDSQIETQDGWYITNKELTEDSAIATLVEKESDESILSLKEFLKLKEKIDNGEATMTPEMYLFYLAYYNLE